MNRTANRYLILILFLLFATGVITINGRYQPLAAQEDTSGGAAQDPDLTAEMQAFLEDRQDPLPLAAMPATPCVGGMAGPYPCSDIDLLAFMPLNTIGGGNGNDIWGWTDPLDDTEYAIMGRSNGTAFVDLSDPENPVYLGNLPSHAGSSSWRDIKTYANHAFIVSDSNPGHGMQVFDLTQLRNVTNPPVTFSETAHYNGVSSAHNVAIDEASGFAYIVGANCSGGLHIVDISTPTSPTQAGCFTSDGYTHDAQCLVYNGPDVAHQGSQICLNSNSGSDTFNIVDVTNKAAPVNLSTNPYPGNTITHQGWISEDHRYFLLGDEGDENSGGHNTRTYIWDIGDLDNPTLLGNYTASTAAIDHNMYVKDNYVYQSNYRAGLRILDLANIGTASLTEVAYFDIYPSSDSPSFNGSWSNYPYFDSGIVIVSGIEQGLFILQPTSLATDFSLDATPDSLNVCIPDDAVYTVEVDQLQNFGAAVTLTASGHPIPPNSAVFSVNNAPPPFTSTLTIGTAGAIADAYTIDIVGTTATRTHTTTVALNLAAGAPGTPTLLSPPTGATNIPIRPTFSWTAVANATAYFLEVATDPGFTNIVYSASEPSTSHTLPGGSSLDYNTQYYWRVTAQNTCGVGGTSTTFDFTTTDIPNVICTSPNVAIPDDNPAGVDDVFNIPLSGQILDLDVVITATHTWVGDLIFTLEHNDTGTTVTLIDQPGLPNPDPTWGCNDNDLAGMILTDGSTNGPHDAACPDSNTTPAYPAGSDWDPIQPLNAFNGLEMSGDWTLNVSDNASGDTGTLQTWCLIPTVSIPGNYGVALSPDMADSGWAGTMVTYTVGITNTGDTTDTFGLGVSSIWMTILSTPSVTLPPGDSTTFDVWVQVAGAAPNGSSDTATVIATSTGDPSQSDTVQLTTTAIAPEYGVELSPDMSGIGYPGTTIYYPLLITNTGTITDSFNLSSNNTWTTTLSPPVITLAPDGSGLIDVWVDIPTNASQGDADTATIYASSVGNPGMVDTAQITTTAVVTPVYGVTLAPDMAETGPVGTSVAYSLTLTNEGNVPDTFALTVTNNWTTTLSTTSVTLAPGANALVAVQVDIPAAAAHNATDTAIVTATSQGDATVSDEATLTTTAIILPEYGVTIFPDMASSGLVGTLVQYTLTVTNEGNISDTFNVTASSTWTTTLSAGTVTIAAGSSAPVTVWVAIPATAANNESDTAVITATSQSDPGVTDSAQITTTAVLTAVYGLALSPDMAAAGSAGATVTYTLWLTNTGNVADTFAISSSSTWTTTLSPANLTLNAGQTGTIQVWVTIPTDASGGDSSITTITAISQADGSVTDSANLTTSVEAAVQPTIYLPIIIVE